MLALAATWALAEFTRSHVLTGFPWALIAQVWIETPIAQTLSVIGPHGLGFVTLLAALAPAVLGWRGLAIAAALVAVGLAFGALRLATPLPERAEPLVIRLVQPNAPQRLKWRADMQEEFYRRHLTLTATPAEPMPAATIWSETAVPFVLGYADELQAEVAASAPGGPVILGIQRLDAGPDHENWFNSLAVLGPGGRPWAVYDKHHLVPFGEYIPLAGAIARLGIPRLTTLTARGFTPGPGPQLVSVPGLPPFLPLICYEAIFPHAMQAPGGRAEWMVQVTNDAWFGELAGPYQHLAQARARAIEQGLPLARAANTGVSAMIDPHGRITAALPLGQAGHADALLPAPLPPTTYARVGDYPALLLMLSIFGLTVTKFCSGIFSQRRR
jgi:apolipoprotein N-acyltransferase